MIVEDFREIKKRLLGDSWWTPRASEETANVPSCPRCYGAGGWEEALYGGFTGWKRCSCPGAKDGPSPPPQP
jgi:hypothetical protein